MRWSEQKVLTPLLMASKSSITMQSLGRYACRFRCENMVFVFFVTLRGRRSVRSSVIYFEQVLCKEDVNGIKIGP